MKFSPLLLAVAALALTTGEVWAQDPSPRPISHGRWMARRYRDKTMEEGVTTQYEGALSDRRLSERRRDLRARPASVAEHLSVMRPTALQRRQALAGGSAAKKPGAPGRVSSNPSLSRSGAGSLSTRRSRIYDPVRAEYFGEGKAKSGESQP